jgi:hypothetical protein
MVEVAPMTTSNVQLQPLPDFQFADPFIFSTEVIAAVLAFVVALHFYKFYRLAGFIYLLGLVIGFSFITFSELMLAIDVWLEFNPDVFNMLFWLRLLSLSYGFSFLAVSYYHKHREEDRTPWIMRIGALSVIPLAGLVVALVVLPPSFDFPPYNQVDEYFRMLNLIALAYVFRSTLVSIVEQGRKAFMYVPAAYAILWLGQYSSLTFALDGNVSSFLAAHIAKVIGLALFVGVFYQIMKEKRLAEERAKT